MSETDRLTVADWRDLYEGMTQADDCFRQRMHELHPEISADNVLSELALAQNRLNYAMMGIHPIYWRDVELSGIADYKNQQLALYADSGERIVQFGELDPSYVEFLENQKRFHNVKDVQPLSSVALRASQELYPKIAEHIEPVPMNTDGAQVNCGAKLLRLAWARSTIMMNYIHEEMQKCGADRAFGVDRDDLRAYCTSRIGSAQFDRGIAELGKLADQTAGMDGPLQ